MKVKEKHWTETLFVKHPELYLPWMQQMNEIASEQADGLQKIFAKHELPEGARVLDLASGLGRISIRLAKAGYDVVGTDISPLYLKLAKRWAKKEGVADRTRFHRVDARNASGLVSIRKGKFDAVASIGTSIGFYGQTADLEVFRNLSKIAKRTAILVVETVNRDYLVKHFQDQRVFERDGIVWHDNRRLDFESSFMRNSARFYRTLRGSLRLVADIPVSHRVYSIHELREMVEIAGWNYLESFGSLRELSPLSTDTSHMTIVARNHRAHN